MLVGSVCFAQDAKPAKAAHKEAKMEKASDANKMEAKSEKKAAKPAKKADAKASEVKAK
jgi:hypothetical protein